MDAPKRFELRQHWESRKQFVDREKGFRKRNQIKVFYISDGQMFFERIHKRKLRGNKRRKRRPEHLAMVFRAILIRFDNVDSPRAGASDNRPFQ